MPVAYAVGLGLQKACKLGRFRDVAWVHLSGLVRAWGEEPDTSTIAKVTARVDEDINEVIVAGSVPEKDNVAKLICVFIKQEFPDVVLDGFGQGRITIFVPPEFLDYIVCRNSQLVYVVHSTSGAHCRIASHCVGYGYSQDTAHLGGIVNFG